MTKKVKATVMTHGLTSSLDIKLTLLYLIKSGALDQLGGDTIRSYFSVCFWSSPFLQSYWSIIVR